MLWPQSILPGARHIALWNSSSMAIVLFCFSLSLLSFYTFSPHVFHLHTLDSYLTKVYLVWIFPLNSRPINTIVYLTTPLRSYKSTSYLKYPRSNSWSPSKDSCLDYVSHLSWWYYHPTNQILNMIFDVSFFLTSLTPNLSLSPVNFTSQISQMIAHFSHSLWTTLGTQTISPIKSTWQSASWSPCIHAGLF